MDELREHPDVKELIETLDQNGMDKEKKEVLSLVDYIGGMEKNLSEMLEELKSMRSEINLIHNNTLKNKCIAIFHKTEEKIKQGFAVLGKVKDNFIRSAANAVKVFKEKGKDAFKKVVSVMKIPETLDRLGNFFGKLSKDIENDVSQLNSMQSELNSAKGHLKNVGLLLIGRESKEAEQLKKDKGILQRLGKLIDKLGKGFSNMSQRAMDASDKLRFDRVESVKRKLEALKSAKPVNVKSEPPLDR